MKLDIDRMRFVSQMYKDGSEAQLFLFNGANEIMELRELLQAAKEKIQEHEIDLCDLNNEIGTWKALATNAEEDLKRYKQSNGIFGDGA